MTFRLGSSFIPFISYITTTCGLWSCRSMAQFYYLLFTVLDQNCLTWITYLDGEIKRPRHRSLSWGYWTTLTIFLHKPRDINADSQACPWDLRSMWPSNRTTPYMKIGTCIPHASYSHVEDRSKDTTTNIWNTLPATPNMSYISLLATTGNELVDFGSKNVHIKAGSKMEATTIFNHWLKHEPHMDHTLLKTA